MSERGQGCRARGAGVEGEQFPGGRWTHRAWEGEREREGVTYDAHP